MRTPLLVMSAVFLLLTGCNPQGADSEIKVKNVAEDPACNPTPVRFFQSEQQAKSITEQINGIDQAVAVHIDDELDVAIKVTNFNRFNLKNIEKEVSKKLKAAFPKENIHVTSDKKLIDELQKLSDTPWSTKQEEACKQKKKIKKIEDQMKG